MKDVMELAKDLGEGIRKDPVLLAYDEAKAAFDADTELSAQMTEYNAQRTCLTEEFNKDLDEQYKAVIEQLRGRMDALAAEINRNGNYTRYASAQKAVSELMQRINEEITYHAFGVRPQHCNHDCAGCSGCH